MSRGINLTIDLFFNYVAAIKLLLFNNHWARKEKYTYAAPKQRVLILRAL